MFVWAFKTANEAVVATIMPNDNNPTAIFDFWFMALMFLFVNLWGTKPLSILPLSNIQTANLQKSKQVNAIFFDFFDLPYCNPTLNICFSKNNPTFKDFVFSFQTLGKITRRFVLSKRPFNKIKRRFANDETPFCNRLFCK